MRRQLASRAVAALCAVCISACSCGEPARTQDSSHPNARKTISVTANSEELGGKQDVAGPVMQSPAVHRGLPFEVEFPYGLAPQKAKDGNWGYVDKIGTFVITPGFQAANPFVEGLAGVLVESKWGFIDTKGGW